MASPIDLEKAIEDFRAACNAKPKPPLEPFCYPLTVGTTSRTIPCHILPYFKSLYDFQTRRGHDAASLHHSHVPFFAEILDVCTTGPLGRFFDVLPLDVQAYEVVAEQLDMFTYAGVADIKSWAWQSHFPGVAYCPSGANSAATDRAATKRERAREAAFQLVCRILLDQSEARQHNHVAREAFMSVLKAVLPSKKQLLDKKARNMVAAAYVRRFGVTQRQMARLKKYGLLDDEWGDRLLHDGLVNGKLLKSEASTTTEPELSLSGKEARAVAILPGRPT